MDVTDVLRDRMQEPSGLQRMITLSLVVHLVALAGLMLAPGHLLARRTDEPANVMRISIAGSGDGPVNGGMTSAAARNVQTEVPEVTKHEAALPPAAKPPDMVVPAKTIQAKPNPKATSKPEITQAPEGARGRTPSKGLEKSTGPALTYTGARGQGFGLSTGGGQGGGSSLDVADFCCPEYVAIMLTRIRSVWQQDQQGARGISVIKFTIQRDGRLTDLSIVQSSGNPLLDTAALRAVAATRSLNPLPSQFPNPTLTVRLSFDYQ